MTPLSLLIGFFVLLTACSPSGVSVYNTGGGRLGRVEVQDDDHAVIYDLKGNRAGIVSKDRVLDEHAVHLGRVSEDNRIYNVFGVRLGRVSNGTICLDASGTKVGSIAEDIDDEAAGGACLLLILLAGSA